MSVIDSFPGCVFVTDCHRDLGIDSNERSWCVDVAFDSFGQIRLPEIVRIWAKLTKTAVFRNMSFSRL